MELRNHTITYTTELLKKLLILDEFKCFLPDLSDITNCNFYWGKIDDYEAETLLYDKPDGTFLMRDSPHGFPFIVSVRQHGKTLHMYMQVFNRIHRFGFTSKHHSCCSSNSVLGLIKRHEIIFSRPLQRTFPFSLQHLCRVTIVSRLTYGKVNRLNLPKKVKKYLKEYHYSRDVGSEVCKMLVSMPYKLSRYSRCHG